MRQEKIERQQQLIKQIDTVELGKGTIAKIEGYFYRTVALRHSNNPLATIGAEKTGGRYNFRPANGSSIPCLYCGENYITATREKYYNFLIKDEPLSPHAVVAIKVELSQVLDLTNRETVEAMSIDWEGITEPWEYFQDRLKIPSYSQKIGKIAYNTPNIEAIQFQSTKHEQHINLAIFTTKLLPNSTIEIFDPRSEISD